MPTRSAPRLLSLLTLAFLCLGHGSGGCGDGGGHHEEEHPHGEATGAACPSTGAPTAQSFGQAFLQRYCLSCHSASVSGPARGGAPVDMNFDTLEDVRRHAEAIDSHCASGPHATNTQMPPAALPQPTLEERQRLGQWLACGAP